MDPKKSIADKYALDYYRRSLPTRVWKSPWNYAALVVALLLVGATYLVARNAAFQAAPVAGVHSSFGANCSTCHEQSWGGGKRLVTLSEAHPSVSDATCAKCHPVGMHAGKELDEPDCTDCHQEHRPERSLVAMADSACTRCHRDLESAPTASKLENSFAANIRRFEAGDGGHPEFAVLRNSDDGVGAQHEARRLATFAKDANGGGRWVDRGGLVKFNHQLHLDPKQSLGPDRKPVTLTCASCHVTDTDGYMRPIVYEQHCRECHPLRLASLDKQGQDLPHSTVEEVRGVIREKLAGQIERRGRTPFDAQDQPSVPRLPLPARLTMDEDKQLQARVKNAVLEILGPEAKGACRHCHRIEQQGEEWVVLSRADNPQQGNVTNDDPRAEMVPSRWLPHARFDHKSHRAVDCVECHQANSSTETADILLPSIAVCRTCHGNDARSPATRVSADCVLCHTYHNGTHAPAFQGVPLDELFPTVSSNDE
jgi:predicted CXXCH cytochrome family protein